MPGVAECIKIDRHALDGRRHEGTPESDVRRKMPSGFTVLQAVYGEANLKRSSAVGK
jgi:hypothetical protein